MPIARHIAYRILLDALQDEPEKYCYRDEKTKKIVEIRVVKAAHVARVVGTHQASLSALLRDPADNTERTRAHSRLQAGYEDSCGVSGPSGPFRGKTKEEVFFEILGCDLSWFEMEEEAFKTRLRSLQASRNARRLGLIQAVATELAPMGNGKTDAPRSKTPVPSVSLTYSVVAAKDASPWDKLAALSLVTNRDKISVEVLDLERNQTYDRKTWRPPPQFVVGGHRANPKGTPSLAHTVLPAGPVRDDPAAPPVLLGLERVNLHLRGFSNYNDRACAVLIRARSSWIVNFLPWHSTERTSNGVVVPKIQDTKITATGTLKIGIDPSPTFGDGQTVSALVFLHQADIVEAYRKATEGNDDLFQKQFLSKQQLDRFATWFFKEHAAQKAATCGASYHQGWPRRDEK